MGGVPMNLRNLLRDAAVCAVGGVLAVALLLIFT